MHRWACVSVLAIVSIASCNLFIMLLLHVVLEKVKCML